jgi:hypothetical protein
MPLILLVLGLVIAVVGAAMVAYGIPINEFSFGNTLIVAGTVALVGGLILIGVASAARQLRRIADNLDMQPMSWSLDAPTATARPTASAAPPAVPLKPENPPAKAEPAEVRPPERVVPAAAEPPPAAESPPADTPPPRGLFRRWFGRGREDADPAVESPVPEAKPVAPEPRVDLAPLAQLPEPEPAPAPRVPPVAKPERPMRPVRPPGEAPRPLTPPARASAPAATVFKSGVIDGMAYTLYTDGSIEAELPQGKVRFGTVEELQGYLLRGKG